MSEEVIDVPEFLERVQDDKELLFELLDIFVGDYRGKRKSLGEAIKKNDYEEVRMIAHSLKGASGNVSAKALRQTFIKIEEMRKQNDYTGAEETLKTMDQRFEELLKRISVLKEELK
ncbi:MAG: hypothetical protein A2Z81_05070 [Omnitrophica WOR_2 bacterium GWA2_45_18]|nr:MAG: hypothetical protein A2Z81_05070 [Omnitrophica WOR_2 bacterium GWA2_45_18]